MEGTPPEALWVGWFRDPVYYGRLFSAATVHVDGHAFSGEGRDPTGSFTLTGARDESSGRVRFEKIYEDGRRVDCAGDWDGSRYRGRWEMREPQTRRGLITWWPARPGSLTPAEARIRTRSTGGLSELRNIGLVKLQVGALILPLYFLREHGAVPAAIADTLMGGLFGAALVGVAHQLSLWWRARRG